MDLVIECNSSRNGDRWTGVSPSSKRQLRFRCYLMFLTMDGAALFAGRFLIAFLRREAFRPPSLAGENVLLLLIFVVITGSSLQPTMLRHWRHAARHAVQSAGIACLAVVLLGLVLGVPRRTTPIDALAGLAVAGIIIVGVHKIVAGRVLMLLDGQPLALALIADNTQADFEISGLRVLHLRKPAFGQDLPYPLLLDGISRAMRGIDVIYVACPLEHRRYWLTALRGSDIPAKLLMPELDPLDAALSANVLGIAQMSIETEAMETRDRAIKRTLDLLCAVPLLIFFAPLIGLLAALIKLDSPGPIFFIQSRVGRGNLLFSMIKFRTMHQASCDPAGNVSATREDRRVTRVGRFLRRTSIDELPQLFNVLRGEMSFVGPRPHALGSIVGDQLFWEVDSRYCDRHVYKPGLTGLAQVRGLRGATHRREDLVARLQADLEYIDGWNVWRDLKIMLATFRVMFHKNAY